MNILMLTNTFSPYVGGVALSVQRFADEYRRQGHQVLVAAPLYKTTPKNEQDVIRFPAIQHFNGTEFSLPIPIPGKWGAALKKFHPDVVHVHHPFALGGTALRVATSLHLPLVFTHHTMYEKYTHYLPGDSLRLKRYVVSLVTGYCGFCDAVIAPSETVAKLLKERGVQTRTEVIPTGVATDVCAEGNREVFRNQINLPQDAFVVGHVGRMATEKNLDFLAKTVVKFLHRRPDGYFLLVGVGPMKEEIKKILASEGLLHRFRCTGLLHRKALGSAYKAMDVFAFSSHTETQGMVLAEAMAFGIPVVAIDASGVREVVEDGINGRLISDDDEDEFASALAWIASVPAAVRKQLTENARLTAAKCDIRLTARNAIKLYESLIENKKNQPQPNATTWFNTPKNLQSEWRIASNIAKAAGTLFRPLEVVKDNTSITVDYPQFQQK